MAYNFDNIIGQITNLKNSGNNAQAYAMWNGLAGAKGLAKPGDMDIALRNAWGEDTAKQWINQGTTDYGNTNFDPTTGQWAGMGNANGQGGQVAGWDPKQFSRDLGWNGAAINYTPTTAAGPTGVGMQSNMTTPMGGGFAKPAPMGGVTGGATDVGMPGAAGGSFAGGGQGAEWNPQQYARPENTKTPFDFFNDAGYQFDLREGTKGIEGSAAARGGLMSGATLKSLTDYKTGLANQHYGEAFDRYNQDRNFNEGQYQSDRQFGQNQQMDARDYNRGVYTNNRDFGEGTRRYDQGFNEDQRRNNRNFDWDQYTNERNFDRGSYESDRDYSTGLDKYNLENDWRNRMFDRSVGSEDRQFDADILRTLFQGGLQGSGQDGQMASFLANLFGNNTMTGANAGASGTMGQANNINNLLQQLMTMMYAKAP